MNVEVLKESIVVPIKFHALTLGIASSSAVSSVSDGSDVLEIQISSYCICRFFLHDG